ncbi:MULTISPECIES: multiple monosaccharide ABC transporter permease [Rhizobium/Agrobacterium group]|jgi:putative multiple sugar transport system permease protein|uniref:Xylose transport system permease protein XylH n=1 Tax=Rhizobium rhizogenes TaxID=359 RepID=A0AA92C6E3_RHIRH|nr:MULTISPECIES: multiple monosaccharide ABC transporter permease [Rhizobium/Agrobacterium group]KQM33554.1 ABC transporter permease [Rhizobium sp. Leaf202]KQN85514.1 ABC transporter permease [Rhizobium sp. Leaf68]KQR33775.1 ABC transporter permease [Rhizobium sp. Leaf155]KQZ95429.1 ABC transporter permease [Rhizobium sp. Root564]MDP9572627.1 putative multiple sugar transport system permease protein [Agrobacterium larrymoorei]MQB21483.1 sugar ABC transporter permease [Agrobacterium tumefacien
MSSTNTSTEENNVISVGSYIRSNIREYGMLIALVAIMLFFQFYTGGILFRPVNLTNLVLQNSFIVIMALGMLLVIVAGHIDLSVGSIVAFVGAIAAILTVQWGMNPFLAALICLIVGGVIGAAQGYWIAYHRIPSFIVTLAGMLVFRGLTLFVLGGKNIGPFPSDFQVISTGFLPDIGGIEGINTTSLILTILISVVLLVLAFRRRQVNQKHGIEVEPFGFFLVQNVLIAAAILFLGYSLSTYRGLPNVLIVMLVLIAIYSFVTRRTTIGRRIYAMGGNEKATKLSGINTERLSFLTFVNMGVLAGLAGMIIATRLNSATPKAGVGFELDVIAACFIGGASASGGVGKITGAVIGAFIMGVMNNGMSIIGLGIDFQQMVKGLVLLAAVFFDVYNKNKG